MHELRIDRVGGLGLGEVSVGIGDVVAGETPLQPWRVVVVGVVEDLVRRKRQILVRLTSLVDFDSLPIFFRG
jgi:hypothetical protein